MWHRVQASDQGAFTRRHFEHIQAWVRRGVVGACAIDGVAGCTEPRSAGPADGRTGRVVASGITEKGGADRSVSRAGRVVWPVAAGVLPAGALAARPGADDLVASVVARATSSGRRVLATLKLRRGPIRVGVAMTDRGGRETEEGAGKAAAGWGAAGGLDLAMLGDGSGRPAEEATLRGLINGSSQRVTGLRSTSAFGGG